MHAKLDKVNCLHTEIGGHGNKLTDKEFDTGRRFFDQVEYAHKEWLHCMRIRLTIMSVYDSVMEYSKLCGDL